MERVKQLTSRTTSYDAIKDFTTHAGTGIHPCVVVEIVLKWWRVRTDREHVDMSFITPLITTIQNVSSWWYNSVCYDERYEGLIRTLDIPEPTAARYIYYRAHIRDVRSNNRGNLYRCISKGDGTPVHLEDLKCTDNMERYRDSVPAFLAFRYNAAVFPPYGDTIHHWYISTCADGDNHVSLIADSREEILDYIDDAICVELHFVPLPDALQ